MLGDGSGTELENRYYELRTLWPRQTLRDAKSLVKTLDKARGLEYRARVPSTRCRTLTWTALSDFLAIHRSADISKNSLWRPTRAWVFSGSKDLLDEDLRQQL